MSTEDRDARDGMDAQTDDALWTLLGRREPPKPVSPYFARRVLREVGLAEEARAGVWLVKLRRWMPFSVRSGRKLALWSGALSGACALGLVCLVQVTQTSFFGADTHRSRTDAAVVVSTPVAVASEAEAAGDGPAADDDSVPVQEDEVIADLDNILQREESRLWTDDTSSTARF